MTPRQQMKKGTFGSPFFLPGSLVTAGADRLTTPGSGRFDYLVAADAAGANPGPLGRAIHHDPDGLEVREPAPLPTVVGVTDVVASRGTLAANGANASHKNESPLVVLVDQALKFMRDMTLGQVRPLPNPPCGRIPCPGR